MPSYLDQTILTEIPGSFVRVIQGNTKSVECICIPIDGEIVSKFTTRDGHEKIALNVWDNETDKLGYNQSHGKSLIQTAAQKAMGADKPKPIFCGSLKPVGGNANNGGGYNNQPTNSAPQQQHSYKQSVAPADDLPF